MLTNKQVHFHIVPKWPISLPFYIPQLWKALTLLELYLKSEKGASFSLYVVSPLFYLAVSFPFFCRKRCDQAWITNGSCTHYWQYQPSMSNSIIRGDPWGGSDCTACHTPTSQWFDVCGRLFVSAGFWKIGRNIDFNFLISDSYNFARASWN